MNSTSIRVLVIGLGSIGRRHARLLSERPDVELLLCDPAQVCLDESSAELQRPAQQRFRDLGQALAAGPEVVFVCTPNQMHVPMARQALDAGADVLVEKPVSDRLAEARDLLAHPGTRQRHVHVGFMLRYEPGLQLMQQMVRRGDIGNVVAGRAMVGSYVTLLNAKSPDRARRPYSLLVDYTHEFDFIRWIVGEVRGCFAAAGSLGNIELKPPQNVIATTLYMAGGALIQVHMDYIQYPQRRIFELFGDNGTLAYNLETGDLQHFARRKEHAFQTHAFGPSGPRRDDLFRRQRDQVLACRRGQAKPMVSLADGVDTLAVADLAIQSCQTGRPVFHPGAGPDNMVDTPA